MRVIFGDREKFLDKFKTCVRARPITEQKLTSAFYAKENTKPLFKKHKILTAQNLYHYYSSCELFKTFKYFSPLPVYKLFKISMRSHKTLYIYTPLPSDSYEYRMGVMWNLTRQMINITDTSESVSSFKDGLKIALIEKQNLGDDINLIGSNFYPFKV